jgi:superfamily II DNA or RNA helicase
MIPRLYQSEANAAINAALDVHRSTLVVMATGLGKTVVFSSWLASRPLRSIVIAHREELIDQAADKLRHFVGDSVAVEMGERCSPEDGLLKPRVVVASIQTLSNPRRLARFRADEFGQGVIDEAHHAMAASYGNAMGHFATNPAFRWLGVTATPKRGDELALGQRFECVAYEYGIEAGIEDGYLVPVRQLPIDVHEIDFSDVRTTAGDLNEGDLDEIMRQEKPLHAVVKPTVREAGDLPTLVFAVSVAHAQDLADMLNRYKPTSAVALSGKTDRAERRKAIEAYRAGDVQFLCNCGLFLEGFDAPATAVVAMARPTKSLSLYVQVLGRGTRVLPGIVDGLATPVQRRAAIAASRKPHMLILDFVGNSGKHKIIRAQDVLGGRYGQPVRDYARRTSEEEKTPRAVGDSLARAADELALLEEIRERERRAAIKARVEYTAREVSPFEGGQPVEAIEPHADGPTDKQVWFLVRRCGWTEAQARAISRRQASGVIGKWMESQRQAG